MLPFDAMQYHGERAAPKASPLAANRLFAFLHLFLSIKRSSSKFLHAGVTITSLSGPSLLSTLGGDTVTISGTGFSAGFGVSYGPASYAPSCTLASSTSLVCTTVSQHTSPSSLSICGKGSASVRWFACTRSRVLERASSGPSTLAAPQRALAPLHVRCASCSCHCQNSALNPALIGSVQTPRPRLAASFRCKSQRPARTASPSPAQTSCVSLLHHALHRPKPRHSFRLRRARSEPR
jgi:hypothetical protein